MTRYNELPPSKKYVLKNVGEVHSEWCKGDPVMSSKSEYNVGMIDEVVLKAQNSKKAHILKNVQIAQEGSCYTVDAVAYRYYKRKVR